MNAHKTTYVSTGTYMTHPALNLDLMVPALTVLHSFPCLKVSFEI